MRIRSLLVAALVLVSLAGCTAVPTSGPVVEVPVTAQAPAIDVAPEPPQDGITPSRLVEGFLQAMADPDGDYSVARQYLTEEDAEYWRPVEALVYDGAVIGSGDSAYIDGTQVGLLDSDGRYSTDFAPLRHDFGVVQEKGQWRIGRPPNGLLLSRYLFERYYTEVSVYYMSDSGSHVVPDPVHLPEQQVTPTGVVEALLRGPSDSIARGVISALPATVRLGGNEASIDAEGVVTVDLTGLSPSLSDEARRRLGAQLIWSLTSIPRVTGLKVTRNGFGFTLPDSNAEGVLELATQQGYQVLSRAAPNAELFAISDGVPGAVSDRFEPWPSMEGSYADLAVSLDAGTIALIGPDRDSLLIGPRSNALAPVETGLANLRRPQFVLGALWVLGDDARGRPVLLTVQRSGEIETVAFDEQTDSRIESYAVSPTGVRAALILVSDEGRRLGIGTIVAATPTRIVGWRELQLVGEQNRLLSEPQAVAFSDETLLGLIANGTGQASVFTVGVDGTRIQDLVPVSGTPVDITALARQGGGAIAIRTESGAAWRHDQRTRWNRLAENITSLNYGG
ncbi:Sporulation and spore germination [Tessaracoccus bendigoensis DSM 12906]|uniref:Sporulation and spore germination n=1 Tax=Tessaracoccus bendigoensis DSM 12906 TaxID=1123357 RepID=A0A1M6AHX0_9ACTN|nr:LpqB family beta-propeller domain-containing protein [Tessaracoccus bendigoensis]SHI35813.1 Sporulation and spore germination [Tessaracoccus bendigoensis DSM 12906]